MSRLTDLYEQAAIMDEKIGRMQAAGDALAEVIQAEIDDAENSLKYFSNSVNIDTLQTWIANRKTKLADWNQAKEMR